MDKKIKNLLQFYLLATELKDKIRSRWKVWNIDRERVESVAKELLGHVQIDTTEIYTHLHDQEVMDAMLNHPLSQFKMANTETFCA